MKLPFWIVHFLSNTNKSCKKYFIKFENIPFFVRELRREEIKYVIFLSLYQYSVCLLFCVLPLNSACLPGGRKVPTLPAVKNLFLPISLKGISSYIGGTAWWLVLKITMKHSVAQWSETKLLNKYRPPPLCNVDFSPISWPPNYFSK